MPYDHVPVALQDRPQWVAWKRESRDGKPTKIPYNPNKPKSRAKSNDASTWSTFQTAKALEGFDGIGFMFSADDPYCGIDLDHCRDPESGEWTNWADKILRRFASYTEISPSGDGLHIIIEGTLPDGRGRATPDGCDENIECYDRLRYFCFTGNHLAGTPNTVEPRQDLLDALIRKIDGHVESKRTKPGKTPVQRAKAYLKKMDPAISGQRGHNTTYHVAMVLIEGFGLSKDEAWPLMFEYSQRCDPPWSEKEIDHKLDDAEKNVDTSRIGHLLKTETLPGGTESEPKIEISKPLPRIISAADLQSMGLKPVKFVVQGYMPVGLIVLAGRPKSGKSWISLQLAADVAMGRKHFGQFPVEEGEVLGLFMEDSFARINHRLEAILKGQARPPFG